MYDSRTRAPNLGVITPTTRAHTSAAPVHTIGSFY